MTRALYRWLLWLHPPAFRRTTRTQEGFPLKAFESRISIVPGIDVPLKFPLETCGVNRSHAEPARRSPYDWSGA